jgi:rhamnosyl/mannosyltransferase
LKALHIYRTYFPDPPGGIQEAIRQICLGTQRHGVESTVFALSPTPTPVEIHRPEARVIRSRSWIAPASCDLGGIESFSRFADLASNMDVVIYHFPWPFADVLHQAVRPKVPSIMLYHSDIVRQRLLGAVYAPLMRRTLRLMSAVIATSPSYARTSPILTEPWLMDKVQVIPLGIEDALSSAELDSTVFQRLGLREDEPFFLFVGVHRYYKGLHTLIQAAKAVQGRIVIAGSGGEQAALQAMAERLNAKNVLFAGHVSDDEKHALLKRCRAFVLPSHLRSEAYGMVLVEAAMFGRPMVSCEIGTGTSFVNAHGESGLVVPPEDPDALSEALNTLLADAHLADELGNGARDRYERLFSGQVLGRSYAELFRSVVARGIVPNVASA